MRARTSRKCRDGTSTLALQRALKVLKGKKEEVSRSVFAFSFALSQLYIDVTNNDFKGSNYLLFRFRAQTALLIPQGGSLLALNV